MKIKKIVLSILLVVLAASPAMQALTVKIGSIAPARSPWDKALKELGREWKKITKGAVQLKIYPGGIAGNEGDMIRKMRMGILGGAVLTNTGLTKLYADVYVLNIPFLIDSDAELDYLLKKMRPVFEKGIEKKGFKIIIWTMAGWVNFFTKKPVFYPEDLKGEKISFTTGEPRMEQAWKKSGYHVVPNELKDLMMGLQSGMVTAFYLPPLIAGSGQYFPLAPNMLSQKISPLMGGIVLSERTWKRIPPQYKKEMLEATRRLGEKLRQRTADLEKETIETMIEHGLVINEVPKEAVEKWKAASNKGIDVLIGKAFSKEVYDQVIQHLKEFRKPHEN